MRLSTPYGRLPRPAGSPRLLRPDGARVEEAYKQGVLIPHEQPKPEQMGML